MCTFWGLTWLKTCAIYGGILLLHAVEHLLRYGLWIVYRLAQVRDTKGHSCLRRLNSSGLSLSYILQRLFCSHLRLEHLVSLCCNNQLQPGWLKQTGCTPSSGYAWCKPNCDVEATSPFPAVLYNRVSAVDTNRELVNPCSVASPVREGKKSKITW